MSGLSQRSQPWRGERFEIRGRLGEGAFGEVFRVYDHRLKTQVALKTLHRAEPAALYHFKREFRALADVHHRNLVELYELLSVEGRWFFTMELVEGDDFLEYAGPEAAQSTIDLSAGVRPSKDRSWRRLREGLKQLAEGLTALHQAGKLHRDIKPTNIKVATEGRVVLLDFGLVKDLINPQAFETSAGEVMGTPAYMAPEQTTGQSVTEASDWYAVGCLLYEALTGERAFRGSMAQIMRAKHSQPPPEPRDLDSRLPEDLSSLCRDLLAKDPAQRPTDLEIRERLQQTSVPLSWAGSMMGGSSAELGTRVRGLAAPFIGRDQELAALHRGFEQTLEGKAVAVFVHGPSGHGKTALVDRFLVQVRQEVSDLVVLAGRCYERESVPHKGLDSLVDTLSGYLKQLPEAEAETLIPENFWALARLFPALQRVQVVVRARRDFLELPDVHEQRRQAREALRSLLQRLARQHPTLLYIDDLQWSDQDSVNFLTHALGPPDPPSLLTVSCERRGLQEESRLLQQLLAVAPSVDDVDVREIEVGRLTFSEVSELGRQLGGEPLRGAPVLLRTLARESGGNPFFMTELVQHARSQLECGEQATSFGTTSIPLENLIWSRLERLSEAARQLMDVVAVAGRPVALEIAVEAAELEEQSQVAVTELLAGNWVCLRGHRQQELESYQDRIRETVMQGLDPASLEHLHRRLATVLEASGWVDAESLAMHFHAAGDRSRAAELLMTAAGAASRALAFDRAARLYRLALDLQPADSSERRPMEIAWANSLAQVGRCPEAAEAYLKAAEGGDGIEALELRRRAAVQQFLSGNAGEAFAMIQDLLQAVGTRLPRTLFGVCISLIRQRVYLKLRGFRFLEQDVSQLPPERLLRIDACWAGLGAASEPLRCLELGIRHLILALEAGEPRRIVRALSQQVLVLAKTAIRNRQRSAELIQLASRIARQIEDPYALGLAKQAAASAAFFAGRWKQAGELLEQAEGLMRQGGVDWELTWVIQWQMERLWCNGRLRELSNRLSTVLKEVAERGYLFLEVMLRNRVAYQIQLVADRPDEAAQELARADALMAPDLDFYRIFRLGGRIEIALYRGDTQAAWEAVEEEWPRLRRYLMVTVQLEEVWARQRRCRAALAMLVDLDSVATDRKLERRFLRDLRRIEGHRLVWADPLAHLLRAGLATLRRDTERALESLIAAEAGFEAADMELYAMVSRRRRGQMLGPTAGQQFVAEADRWMDDQGVRNAARLADAMAPGVWDAGCQRVG